MGAKDTLINLELNEKKKILVIDDDEFALELISLALKQSYDLRLVSQGALALKSAQEYCPDLIILDLNMPNVDGYEVLSQFKSHPLLSTIPVFCLSGEKSLEARQHIRDFGAVAFMTKPINKVQLVADIEQILKDSNLKLESEDQKIAYLITRSTQEKEKAIQEQINEWLEEKNKVLLITLTSGKSFCTPEELSAIEEERLFFLQFKGNILSKLPFMEDLSPIMYDLEDIVGVVTKNLNLIIDDPDILLNIYESSSSRGHIFLFSELLDRNFSKISYFSKRPTGQAMTEKLNSLATLLTTGTM